MRTRLAPMLVLALALSFLSTLPAQAAPRALQIGQPRLFARLVTLIASLPEKWSSSWEKEGAGVDPFGGTPTPPEGPTTNPTNTESGSGVGLGGKE